MPLLVTNFKRPPVTVSFEGSYPGTVGTEGVPSLDKRVPEYGIATVNPVPMPALSGRVLGTVAVNDKENGRVTGSCEHVRVL
ncbi:hypothetical protein [Mucilaginibacter agri]|uniref:Uncharacterized protein n=1 Tax=Mucilaginibacter agri TaxID=2695265 RepID=A0A966DXM5_9SPHI|nr:hypothetical protein [Mucilaginibacter agri]NCD72414.1 hypothetical protein [Mucilaginibacter agri]